MTDINFASDLSVTNDGDGSVTVDATGAGKWNDTDADTLLEPNSGFEGIDLTGKSNGRVLTELINTDGSDFTVETGTTSAASAQNIVHGHANNNVKASAVGATIGGGGSFAPNEVTDDYGTIGGGENNTAGDDDGDNTNAPFATVGGGRNNDASGKDSFVGGGTANTASALRSTVGGGIGNSASNSRATVGGGSSNSASGNNATIGGGGENQANSDFATVGGGNANTASGTRATVGGGIVNTSSGQTAVVGGGEGNTADSNKATVGGGWANQALASYATIAGGGPSDTTSSSSTSNIVYDNYGAIGGGGNNQAGSKGTSSDPTSSSYATVPGGRNNTASGKYSFAAGRAAAAQHDGTFVWSDSGSTTFDSTAADQFLVDAAGGVGINTDTPGATLDVAGNVAINELGMEAHQTTDIGVSGDTKIIYDDEIVDDRNEYDPTTGEFTCAHAGSYHVEAQVEWDFTLPDHTGIYVRIRVNGSIEIQNYQETAANTNGPTQSISKTIRNLSSGDVITISADHNDGSNTHDAAGIPTYAQLQISQIG